MNKLNSSSFREWVKSTAWGTLARILAIISQFGVLLLLGRILDQASFGNMMIAFAIYRIINFSLGSGFGNLVLLYVARDNSNVHGTSLYIGILKIVFTISAVFVGLICLGADTIANVFSKPEIATWLISLSPMLIFGTVVFITAGFLDGKSLITRSIILVETAPNLLRLIGLGFLWIFDVSTIWIPFVLWGALLLPWLVEVRLSWPIEKVTANFPSKNDFSYAAKSVAQSVGSMQIQGFDMLIVGYLFSSVESANYALASRIAVFFPFISNILGKTFTPLAARYIYNNEINRLQQLIFRMQAVNAMAAFFNIAGCLVLAMILVRYFMPEYLSSLAIVAAMALSQFIRAFYFGVDKVMQVGSMMGKSAIIQYISLLNLFIVSYTVADIIGVFAIPVAMLFASAFLNPLAEYFVRKKYHIRFVGVIDFALMMIAVMLVSLAIIKLQNYIMMLVSVGVVLSLLGAVYLLKLRKIMRIKNEFS